MVILLSMRITTHLITAVLLLFSLGLTASCKNKALTKTTFPHLADIKLPPGFSISIFADSVDNARSLARGTNGTIFVGNRSGDKVFALVDKDGDGYAEQHYTIAKDMNTPNGVAFKDGALYVAEIDKIWRFNNIESNLANPPKPVLVFDDLPSDKHHGWKYIAFGPDGLLYIPVGAPCNICNDAAKDPRYASITRLSPDGKLEVYAHGIRNSVGFDWHPDTKELWFTENGRDQMGDNIPNDELNHAPKAGMHFGYPFCHAGTVLDPEFGKGRSCDEFTKPVALLAPHTATLGMKFYTGSMFPASWKNTVFIAEHGSWNRTEPIGYRITTAKMTDTGAVYETFADGWLKDGKAWGRPVDVLQLPDGSMLVSDDFANVVYRIAYKKP